MSERIWSDQQRAIFGWFADGEHHLVVRARAGTGKSSTILEGINHAPESRILLAAFNKRIQEELAGRLQNPNAEAKTLHGVGYACVRRFWERINVASGNARERALAEAVCGDQIPDAIKRYVGKLCTKGREMLPHVQKPEQLMDVALEHDCIPEDEWTDDGYGADYVCERALEAMLLAAEKKPAEGIDFADMLYLPLRNRWMRPVYDLVVVDEAQDMSIAQLELAQGVCGGRFCVVGDDRQAIYGWRGADSGSLDRLKAALKATELGLTTTYRCGKAIVALAQELVPDIEAYETNGDGVVRSVPDVEAMMGIAEPGDFILSRLNAPLVSVAMTFLRQQRRCRIQGRDVGAGLKGLAKRLIGQKRVRTVPEFMQRLGTWEMRESQRCLAMDREDQADRVHDQAEVLRAITDGIVSLSEIDARLEQLFSDNGGVGQIICSSVHKAKGLEAKRVFILRETLFRQFGKGPMSEGRWREEQNIAYVAMTRAKEELVWIERGGGRA